MSIQEAIDNSKSGDTIFVKSGIYFESIIVDKSGLKIVGENRDTTIIDGCKTSNSVYVEANNTVLNDFTVQNSGSNFIDSGICLNQSFNCIISNNKVSSNNIGIYIFSSPNCRLRNNNITRNQYNFGVSGHNLQEYIQDIDVSNIVDGKPVIYWVNQDNKQIPANAGYVAIINSTKITIKDVTATNNWQAVLYAYTTDSIIENVTVSENMDAIWLIETTNCSVIGNNVKENNWGGIALVNSYLCSVQGNDITSNKGYGIFLSYASDNIFYHNNFYNNKRQAWLYGINNNAWDVVDIIGGNYWSDYNGTDNDKDDIGDTSYVIDSNNKDNYPLMQPWIIPPPESSQSRIELYIAIGATITVIAIVIVSYILKFRKQSNAINTTFKNKKRDDTK